MDKHQKKQIKRYIAWACLALLVALLSVMPLLAEQKAEEDGPQASILTATMAQRSIDTNIIGGGHLTSEVAEDVTIPEAVKLTKYLVGNGDTVKKGDAIARVDKVSVMLAISEVQETLDYLAKEIAAAATEKESDKITAQASGVVKTVYGKAGDSVRDVMLEHGALAVLSLDDKMAVDIPCDTDLTYSDSVTVTLSSGKQVKGFVEANIRGILTVTIEDKSYSAGEAVSISTAEGNSLGSGELYIHNPWHATAYYGTVKKVNVKAGDKVHAGKQLFQLTVGDHSAAFQILSAQRQEYEELMQELFEMHSTGVLTAPCDGFVTGVDKEGAFLLAADSGEQSWFFQPLSNSTDSGWNTILLMSPNSSSVDNDPPPSEPTPSEPTPSEPVPSEPLPDDDKPGIIITPNALAQGVVGQPYSAAVQASDGTTPLTGTWTQTGLPEGLTMDSATGTISGTPVKEGNYVVAVSFTCDSGNSITYYALHIAAAAAQAPGIPGMGDLSGLLGGLGGFAGFGGFGGMGGYSAAPAFEPYSLATITIASVTSQEKMALEIAVDEQDITKLYIGQQATITVEALTGQNFPAVITSIGTTGTNAGGSSKFTVKLALSKTGDMLPGMNASAYLPLQSQTVTVLPVAALAEEGGRTVVYTGYNEKDEVLTNPVTVTTGISDGEYVQILSGLTENDTVYYAYYDTLEHSRIPERGLGF